jgi:tetratricopeptide (TPR) repeat protein
VELNPDSSEAHLNLGIALADSFDLEGALEEFTQATRLDPNSAAARFNRGRALFQTRRNEEAKKDLAEAVRLDPGHAQANYFLALAERQLDQPAAAAEALRKVIALTPGDASAHYQLGVMTSRLGRQQEAVEHWKRAVELNPDHGEALYNLFRTLSSVNPEEAKTYEERFELHRTRRRLTDRAETLGNFALASLQAGDLSRAIEQLEEAIEVCGECRTRFLLHKNLGLIYSRSGDLENGEKQLRLAEKINSSDPEIQQSLQQIAHMRGEKVAREQ